MPVSSGSVLLRAAVHLNDPSQLVYTPSVLLPFLNMAVDELSEEMAVFELSPLIQDSAILPVLKDASTIVSMPIDFVEAIAIIERPRNSSYQWVEVKEVDIIDNNLTVTPSERVVQWAIRNTTIEVNPPTSDREVTLTYLRGLLEADGNNNIDIDFSRRFLALLTARNAARDAGNSITKAASFVDDITRARDRLIRRMQKNTQSVKGARRLPYTGRNR